MDRLTRIALLIAFLWYCFPTGAFSQTGNLHQLREKQSRLRKVQNYHSDTAYLNVVNQIAFLYADSYPDSALKMVQTNIPDCKRVGYGKGETEALKITGNAYMTKGDYTNALNWYRKSYEKAQSIDYKNAFPGIRNNIGLIYMSQGNYTAALNEFYAALQSANEIGDRFVAGSTLNNIAIIHFYQGKLKESEKTYRQTLAIASEMADTIGIVLAYNNIAEINIEQNALPEALENLNLARALATRQNNPEMLTIVSHSLGSTYYRMDSLDKAAAFFEIASKIARQHNYSTSTCKALIGLARVYFRQGLLKEALNNGLEGVRLAKNMGHTQLLRDANEIVSTTYEKMGDGMNSLSYFKAFKIYSDSLRNLESERIATTYDAKLEFSRKEDDLNRKNLKQKWLTFSAFAGLVSLGIILLIVNHNRKKLNHTYKELQQKNIVIESERKKVEATLHELKSTQAQLIQSEKMASLGELTAGIAHEIQNPLNFVNNFSETSIELLEEMQTGLDEGNTDEVKAIAADLTANMQRINQHGKRADSIVKGMLQHSRASSGQKEPTDINALAEEYLRLSYHGLRAKDKSFEAAIETDFDPALGKIMLAPQDIGRVILNLANNAFYAVHQKQKTGTAEGYKPTVSVSTRKLIGETIIRVNDNGNGIPESIRSKIFQPFFTTKPTGQGTGLGLSLSYDIITKGCGGTIDVQSKEGGGTEFTITLPG
ncbi:tetratricopeptide repeat protein [Dyadobacter sp. CY261]|uniref:tetratricopeptide repeat-containing sensor histidine kinase n=1 Tax=Dyadobacter sp. CY261 TaxID=2907203 RepID=UPI001F3CF462|nr:tetratricopeptide repeat protein [Dyadobacter sp. CY261]MCF0075022.1 tetratricopeptide repeat protein [Dyadobacter sp. CY261]